MSKFVHFPRLHFDYRRPIIKVQEAKERYRYCRISKGDAAMGEKDIAEKILEDYPDVFADIVNGFLFEGKEVIKPDELEDMPLRSAYRAEKKLHDMERDVAKRWRKNDIRIACVGFENQTAPDPLMVLRVLGYDGAEYRAQCLKENAKNKPYPVITLVLYFGYEKRWTTAKTLYEAVDVPEEFKPYVTDTKINVFEVAWLEEEQVKNFKSDFRIVADYFVQKRKTGSYIASEETMNHMQELLTLLSVMEHDDHFEQAYYKKAVKGGVRNMASVFDDYFKQGEERGKAQKEAEVNERVAVDMIRDKYPLEAIKKISKLPEATIRQLAKSLGVVVL